MASTIGQTPLNIAAFDECSSIRPLPAESIMNCRSVDLLKPDIEGAETEALLAVPHSALQRVSQITVEFHSAELFGGLTDRTSVERAVRHVEDVGFLALVFSTRRPAHREPTFFLLTGAASC